MVERKQVSGTEWLIAAALIGVGFAISALSMVEIRASQPQRQLAQAAQPVPAATPEAPKEVPAQSKPGSRPTTPAPEPARPDPDAQKAGVQPALPPAPAEKIAPPIKEK